LVVGNCTPADHQQPATQAGEAQDLAANFASPFGLRPVAMQAAGNGFEGWQRSDDSADEPQPPQVIVRPTDIVNDTLEEFWAVLLPGMIVDDHTLPRRAFFDVRKGCTTSKILLKAVPLERTDQLVSREALQLVPHVLAHATALPQATMRQKVGPGCGIRGICGVLFWDRPVGFDCVDYRSRRYPCLLRTA